MIECACGCKSKLTPLDKWGRPRQYVNGHNGRKYKDPKQYKREWNKRNPNNYKLNKFKYRLRKEYG